MSTPLRPLRPLRSSLDSIKLGVPAPPKRKNVSSACVACRSRRHKCDGSRPCSQCVRLGEDCEYQTDHRSRGYMQKALAKSNEQSAEVNRLLEAIRESSQSEAAEIVRALRSGDDVSTALKGVEIVKKQSPWEMDRPVKQGSDEGAESPPPFSSSAETFVRSDESSVAPSILGLLQPFDQMTSPLRAGTDIVGPWTTVTNDGQIIDDLLHLYFTYHHPICQVIPEQLIRADMANGRTTYCSPLLINTMLAVGCTVRGSQDDMVDSDEVWPSEEAFINEARQLFAEDPKPSFTAVAALTVLAMIENLHLRYQRAWTLSGRASRMALFLGLQKDMMRERGAWISEPESRSLAAARQQLFWVCFQVDQISSSNVGRQPQIAGSDITLKFPRIAHFSDTEPRTLSPTPALFAPSTDHSNCAFYLTELSKVVNELLIESKTLLLNQQWVNVKTWEPRYLAWYESLPNSLVVAENGPAHIIAMHMWYHGSIIRTFQPILAVGRSEQNTMRLMCQQAAETITGLFRRYRSLYGLMGLNALVVQAVLDAYSVQLQSFPSSCEDLLTVIEAFQQLSHAHGWARTCLLKLEAQILQSHVAEPAAIIDALFGRCGIMPHPTTMSACPVTAPSAAYYDQVVPSFSIESPESQYDFLWEAAPRPPPRGGHYFFSPFA